jgi:ribosome-binding protein aMBF1 (putative translation factor)
MARRIQCRAIERGGELLATVKASREHARLKGEQSPSSRKAFAKDAGLSPDQAKTMLRGDEKWAGWSDNEIARRCKVSEHLVARLRQELAPVHTTRIRSMERTFGRI